MSATFLDLINVLLLLAGVNLHPFPVTNYSHGYKLLVSSLRLSSKLLNFNEVCGVSAQRPLVKKKIVRAIWGLFSLTL